MQIRRLLALLLVAVLCAGEAGAQAPGNTLSVVRQRGYLKCGVSEGLAGFSVIDDKGAWRGIDVDLCRAVAAAVFGDASKVRYTLLTTKVRFTALQTGEIDVLSRNTTWTLGRDAGQRLTFVAVNYYDGQAFMVPKDLGIKRLAELDGATVCVQQGTTTEQNVADYFRARGMRYELVTFERDEQVVQAYEAKRCDAYSTDLSGLYADRVLLKAPDAHVILPEIISKEPLGPAVREGDDRWADIVRWSHFVMVAGEELGVTMANVDEKKKSTNPEIRRLLGLEGDFGAQLGLSADWSYAILKQVGNYGESFARNLGKGSPLGIARGQNALWRDGGLQYAPPLR
jgi:general L-amino acid transport system substrate-binding protein